MDLRDGPRRNAASSARAICGAIFSPWDPDFTTDGRRLYRGPAVAVRPDPEHPLARATRGWVDLRPEALGRSIGRAAMIVPQAERWHARGAESGSDVGWTAIDTDGPIEPAPVATRVFRYEDHGERIKR